MDKITAARVHGLDCQCDGCAIETALLHQCQECAKWLENNRGKSTIASMQAMRLAMARKLAAFIATRIPGEDPHYKPDLLALVEVMRIHARGWAQVHAVREAKERRVAGLVES